jgi:hypothetical protein
LPANDGTGYCKYRSRQRGGGADESHTQWKRRY